MYLIAQKLVIGWDALQIEFKPTKTLQDKNLLIAMMSQPWELCDDSFNAWTAANKITLPAIKTLRTVPAKHLYSDWVCLQYCSWQIVYTQMILRP